ncbi:MAG TPA: DUF308 domain-containing protein [Gaiellaceae bacterium]
MTDLVEGTLGAAARFWWLFLAIGTAWLLLAVIVFRFDYRTVNAISILFGIVVIGAAVDELFAAWARSGWVRLAHAALAVAFVVIAVIAFVHPGNTFAALAAVMSFYFVLKGTLAIALALAFREETGVWWLQLLLGIAEILIGFWAAGDFGHRAFLLVVWVGVAALTRGISAIFFAFAVRGIREPVARTAL